MTLTVNGTFLMVSSSSKNACSTALSGFLNFFSLAFGSLLDRKSKGADFLLMKRLTENLFNLNYTQNLATIQHGT